MTPETLTNLATVSNTDVSALCASVLNIMKVLGIDRVSAEYTGSGDSPEGCDVELWRFDASKIHKDDDGAEVRTDIWVALAADDPKRAAFSPYEQAVGEVVFAMSFEHWGGWYNNEGGHGSAEFVVHGEKEPRASIELYEYVQDSHFMGKHEYDATGAHS